MNKLAVNFGFGRNWSGVHWRSDAAGSMALGEAVAIGLLRDERTTLREAFDGFSFTRFDGTRVTICRVGPGSFTPSPSQIRT